MTRRSFVSTVLFFVGPAFTFAQPVTGEEPLAVERIEQLRKVRMIEALDLSEHQAVRFFARLNEHNKAKEDLQERRTASLDKLERMVRNEAGSDELRNTFAEMTGIDQEIHGLDAKFFSGLPDILSEEQRAKLLLFERQFHRELLDALQAIQRRRYGPDHPDQ